MGHVLSQEPPEALAAEVRRLSDLVPSATDGNNPYLSELFEAVLKTDESGFAFGRRDDGIVSLMWYPHYPESSPSCTHTKLSVDGCVWSTMDQYRPMKSREAHERLAQRFLRNSYFEFRLQASKEQLRRLKHFLFVPRDKTERNCIAGACQALYTAGIIKRPLLLDAMPPISTAIYLGLLKVLPGVDRVEGIRFHGRSIPASLASVDVLIDGAITISFLISTLYVPAVLIYGIVFVIMEVVSD